MLLKARERETDDVDEQGGAVDQLAVLRGCSVV